jgi:ABC-2 type transport system permease protein
MKTIIYAKRNSKELMSDRLSLIFMIGLPAFLLVFMVTLNRSLGVNDAFDPRNFVPSTIIFSYAFLTMFSAMLIAKDRSSSFLKRMFVSPLKAHHYVLGYMLPLVGIAFVQSIVLYLIGFLVGLTFSVHVLLSLFFLFPIATLFIVLGLLFGSVLKDRQVGPIVSILVQVVAFLSGMWFSLDLVGGWFETLGRILPFSYGVDMIRDVLSGEYGDVFVPLVVIMVYMITIGVVAVVVFRKKMKR